jgi:hypothetical protein
MAAKKGDKDTRVTKLSKGFKVRTYAPVPEGFDPRTATDRQLLRYGFPRRPHARAEADWRARWDKAFVRPVKWIVPEFREIKGRSNGRMRPSGRKKAARRGAAAVANATSGNWSGAVNFSAAGSPYKWVAGQWTVPNPHAPSSGAYYASEWVGIDGWNSADVLQAGTETQITQVLWFHVTNVYTWWEWFPSGEVAITNLPVSPGDIMYCLICVNSTSSATVYFSNQSTNVGTSFTITAPSGTTLVGNCAEWIVERPTVGGSTAALTDYAAVYFDECIAGWVGNNTNGLDDLGGATTVTMTGTGGASLSVPTVENNRVLKLTWRKSS